MKFIDCIQPCTFRSISENLLALLKDRIELIPGNRSYHVTISLKIKNKQNLLFS